MELMTLGKPGPLGPLDDDAGLMPGRVLLCRTKIEVRRTQQGGLLPTARDELVEFATAFATPEWPAGSIVAVENGETAKQVQVGDVLYWRIYRDDVVLVRKPI